MPATKPASRRKEGHEAPWPLLPCMRACMHTCGQGKPAGRALACIHVSKASWQSASVESRVMACMSSCIGHTSVHQPQLGSGRVLAHAAAAIVRECGSLGSAACDCVLAWLHVCVLRLGCGRVQGILAAADRPSAAVVWSLSVQSPLVRRHAVTLGMLCCLPVWRYYVLSVCACFSFRRCACL